MINASIICLLLASAFVDLGAVQVELFILRVLCGISCGCRRDLAIFSLHLAGIASLLVPLTLLLQYQYSCTRYAYELYSIIRMSCTITAVLLLLSYLY